MADGPITTRTLHALVDRPEVCAALARRIAMVDRARILEILRSGPATVHELGAAIGISGIRQAQSLGSTLRSLRRAGLVTCDVGSRRYGGSVLRWSLVADLPAVPLRTISLRRMTKAERRAVEPPDPSLPRRPKTRGDCVDGPRPCAFVSCRHHLALDVTPAGSIVEAFPGMDVSEMPETCSLDVADRGGMILDQLGAIMGNLSRERIRQIETGATRKLKRLPMLSGIGSVGFEHPAEHALASAADGAVAWGDDGGDHA